MKNFFCLLIAVLTLTSCETEKIYSSGNIETETYELNESGKYKVVIGGNFELVLTDYLEDDVYEIIADDNIIRHIDIEDKNNTLKVTLDNEVDKDATLKVYVSSMRFNMITASGLAIVVNEDDFPYYENYYVTLSGMASYIGPVNCDSFFLSQSGSSNCDITSGSCYTADIEMSGSSEMFGNLTFSAEKAVLDMSGSSSAKAVITDKIEGKMSGSSYFKCRVDISDVDVDISGSAEIEY